MGNFELKLTGKTLRYPVGVGDLKELAGKEFDSNAFLRVPQKLYMGALDTNDTIPFRDSWDADEAEFIQRSFGEKMQPDRWNRIQKIYQSAGANVVFNTYAGVGHKVTPEIEEEIFQFFSAHR